jgi:hypothetical protein
MRRVVIALVVAFGVTIGLGLGSVAVARAEPPNTHEIIYTRPSGFWTSNRPAVGGAYRWRLLGIGAGIALLTGALMLRAVKRASAERDARDLGKL